MLPKQCLRKFSIDEFLPGNQADDLPDNLDLLENGILDSLAVPKLVAYIENSYDIALEPEEINPDNLNSINAIFAIVQNKKIKPPERFNQENA